MNKDHVIGFGFGVLAGAVIGGGIALLYAPKSGKKNRQQIMDNISDAMDTVKEKTDDAMDMVRAMKS